MWVWIAVGAYWIYCIYCGIKGARVSKTAGQYMIAGRQLPMWVFLLAATATSFSGWTFVGHPGSIWQHGLAYAFASFYALTIPLTGAFFAKRQWLLGKRYGFVTPGDMYAYYFGTEGMRWLVVLVAFLYSAFYSAVQLMAAGALFHWVTGVPVVVGSILLAAVVVFYVAAGGLRSVAWVDCLQCILLIVGIIVLGAFTLKAVGGWSVMSQQLALLDTKYLKIPGVIKFTAGETHWTGVMIMTYMFALMGIQSSPAFTMWSFSNKNPRPFAWQQVFMSTALVGFAMFFFTGIQGMGARILGDVLNIASDADVVPMLMHEFLPAGVLALVTIGAIAAMQSTASPYIGTGSTIICRDVFFRYIRPRASHKEQIWTSRTLAVVITAVAMIIAFTSKAALVMLGALATSLGTLMWLPLLGVIYGLRITGAGVLSGLIAGIVAVFLTYQIPAFKYPLTIHCAGWGIFTALAVGLLVSYFTADSEPEEIKERRREIRNWLNDIDAPTPSQKAWRKVMWVVVPVWFLFAIGPFAVLGNNAFSFLGFPHAWAWQLVWWVLGIIMMWALCFKAGLATCTEEQIARAEKELKPVVFETVETPRKQQEMVSDVKV
ncbi:MAG: sodium:solute symporter family protein [Peptococcaceae bacterium]|nr:sodium:solute symporter family protein [Peptococcaceae bacterium]